MQKIDFVNSQQPAINDTNLNQMQLNIENAINAQVAGDTLPVGSIMPYTSDTVPENWLLCDGSAVSRTTYDLLFSIIGTTYGVGDGSTTFNLPNLKGRVAVGKDSTQTEFDTLGETGGNKTVSHTHELSNGYAQIQIRSEGQVQYNEVNVGANTWVATYQGAGTIAGDISATGNYGAKLGGSSNSTSIDVTQPYIITNYIIKAQQSAGIVATVVDNLTSTSSTDALSAKQGKILGSYSTSETVVGTWIDGKPLYKKVIDFGALPNNTIKNVAHSISNLKQIVKLEGFAGSSSNAGGTTLPHATTNPVSLFADSTNVSVLTTNDRTAYTKTYIYIEYTKTTD